MTLPWAPHYDPGVPLTVEPVTTSVPELLLDAAAKTPQARPWYSSAGASATGS